MKWGWICFFAGIVAVAGTEFDEQKSGFAIEVGDEVIDLKRCAIFVMPDSSTSIREVSGQGALTLVAEQGRTSRLTDSSWQWQAPHESGPVELEVRHSDHEHAIQLVVFVLVPAELMVDDVLKGYRIGAYPEKPYRDLPIYAPPQGYVQVDPGMGDIWVSPHFQLRQFLCKQGGGPPQFLVLRTRLLLKLELILATANQRGYRCSTFAVLSGYRTPHYNRSIGNVKYSRHVWGGAADIFIDEAPKDGMMDDLNRDGVVNMHDAAVLYELIDGFYGSSSYRAYIGGLGRYRKTANHGPFVHVDVRGFRARWGD